MNLKKNPGQYSRGDNTSFDEQYTYPPTFGQCIEIIKIIFSKVKDLVIIGIIYIHNRHCKYSIIFICLISLIRNKPNLLKK